MIYQLDIVADTLFVIELSNNNFKNKFESILFGLSLVFIFKHKCRSKTDDGHQGTDFVIRSFAAMDSGVAVLAAASGTVISVKNDLLEDII